MTIIIPNIIVSDFAWFVIVSYKSYKRTNYNRKRSKDKVRIKEKVSLLLSAKETKPLGRNNAKTQFLINSFCVNLLC